MAGGPSDVLIVVDVQTDFCPGGRLAVPGGDEVVMPINRIAAGFAHVVLTQDWHPAGHHSFASSHPGRAPFETVTAAYGPQVLWPDHCVQGSAGAAFHPALDVPHAALVLRKGFRREINSYSAFYENDRTTPTGLAGLPARARPGEGLPRRPRLRFLRALVGRRRPPPRLRGDRHRGRLPGDRPRRLGGCDAGELCGARGGVRGGGGGGLRLGRHNRGGKFLVNGPICASSGFDQRLKLINRFAEQLLVLKAVSKCLF